MGIASHMMWQRRIPIVYNVSVTCGDAWFRQGIGSVGLQAGAPPTSQQGGTTITGNEALPVAA